MGGSDLVDEAVLWMPLKYCSDCGSKMVLEEKTNWGFDVDDGSKRYRVLLKCPNMRHWWDSHDRALFRLSKTGIYQL